MENQNKRRLMENLHEHIKSDILKRLPAKCLQRLKCVSKGWYNLISSPIFIKLHVKRAVETNIDLNFVVRSDDSLVLYNVCFESLHVAVQSKLQFPPEYRGVYTDIVGSCNGLFCLLHQRFNVGTLALCNPSTQDFKILPACTSSYNNCIYSTQYGFGYDGVTQDYKLVRIISDYFLSEPPTMEAQVYSMTCNTWKGVYGLPPYRNAFSPGTCFYSKNALLWVVAHDWAMKNDGYIITFDLHKEEFDEMQLPTNCDISRGWYIFSSRFLCLSISKKFESRGYGFEMWIMKECGIAESWIKLLTAEDIYESHPYYNFDRNDFGPIAYIWSEGYQAYVLVLQDYESHNCMLYNLKNRTVREVEIIARCAAVGSLVRVK